MNGTCSSGNDDDITIPKTMKAVVIRENGGPECLSYETDYPAPDDLKPGEAIIKNVYAGLNFIDTYYRKGLYKQSLPFIGGQEAAGIVVKINYDTSNDNDNTEDDSLKVGDKVVYTQLNGTYCEYTKVPIDKLIRIPTSSDNKISMEVALSSLVQGMTAHYLTSDAHAGLIKKGEWMLLYSVGSGTCKIACQLAKLNGYKVIGTTTKNKLTDVVKNSCDHIIVLDEEEGKSHANYNGSIDIHQKVMEYTNGEGVKCIIDGVGKSTADISVRCLARRGIWISFGNASGPVPPFALLKLTAKSAYVTRPKLKDYVPTPLELQKRSSELFRLIGDDKLRIDVDLIEDLSFAKRGHEYIESGRTKGKVIFKI